MYKLLIPIRMKKLLLLFVALFCLAFANAQERYEVTSKSALNIRSSASASSTVLGTVQSGSKVDVYEVYGEWAKIKHNGRFAYVSSKYLKKCSVEASQNQKEENKNSFLSKFDDFVGQYATHDIGWMIFVIFGLSVVLAIVRGVHRDGRRYLRSGKYIFHLVAFVIICVAEIVYFLKMGSETTWFCMPSEVGWIGAIVGFLAFGWAVYNQVMWFIDTLLDIRYNAGDFDMRIGLYSWPIAIVVGGIVSLFKWEGALEWVVIILGVCQLIQIILIIVGVSSRGGFLYSLLVSAIYLIGAVSTLFLFLYFLALVIIVVIIGFFIMAFLRGGSRSSSSSESSSESSSSSGDDSSSWKKGYLDYTDGLGRIEGKFSDENTFHEYGGGTYDRQGNGTWKKREYW